MMITSTPRSLGMVALIALMLAGCASVPSQEMSDARRAISAAEKAQAAEHAPVTLASARESLAAARDALARGDYPSAETAARRARRSAIDARALAAEMQLTALSIEDARRDGRPVAGAEAFMQRARDVAAGGDAERALELLVRARALAR